MKGFLYKTEEKTGVFAGAEDIRFFEELSLNAHPSFQTKYYDGWLLGVANGYTNRANSVNMIYPSTIDLQTKIKVCEEYYCQHQLPCVFKMTDCTEKILDEMLQERGYKVVTPTDVMTMDLANKEFASESCIIMNQVTQEWLDAFFTYKRIVDYEVCKTATHIMHLIQDKTLYCRIEQNGVCVGCASGVIERGYMYLANVIVDERSRGKGFGQKLCEALLAKAKEEGAHTVYLNVIQSNQTAINLYKKLGCRKAYSYWYRVKEN